MEAEKQPQTALINDLAPASPPEPQARAGKPIVPQVPRSKSPELDVPIERTWGEKWFDRLIYWGNGFGVNLLLSAAITMGVNHTRAGRGVYKWLDNTYKKAGISDEYTRNQLSNAFTLLTGGHVTAVAVKLSENRKGRFVRWLDKKHYGEDAENNPEIAAAHARIDAESQPTWKNILLSRVICWATIQATAFTVGKNDNPLTYGDEGNLLMKFGRERNIPGIKNFSVDGISKSVGKFLTNPSRKSLARMGDQPRFSLIDARLTRRQETAALTRENTYERERLARGMNARTSDEIKADAFIVPKSWIEQFSIYAVMDTLYTAITAWMLKPVIRELGKELPGMRTDPKTMIDKRLQGRFALPEQAPDEARDESRNNPAPVGAMADYAAPRPNATVHAVERAGYAESAMALQK
jgi:hypothetical protein